MKRNTQSVVLLCMIMFLLICSVVMVNPSGAWAGSVDSVVIKAFDSTGTSAIDPKTLKPGDIFWAKVMFYNAVDLKGVDIYLQFDPSVLQMTRTYDASNDLYTDVKIGAIKKYKVYDPTDPTQATTAVSNTDGWVKYVASNSAGANYTDTNSLSPLAALSVQFKVNTNASQQGSVVWVSASALGGAMAIDSNQAPILISATPLYAPQAALTSLTLGGTVTPLNINDIFNLSGLALSGKDQFNNSLNLAGLPVTFTSDNTSVASVTYDSVTGKSTLTAHSAGTANITATVQSVTSNSVAATVNAAPALTTLTLAGSIPNLDVNGTVNLTNTLTLSGKDQNNNSFNIAGLPVTFASSASTVAGVAYDTSSGWILTANAPGTTNITATVQSVTSNSIAATVNALPALSALTIQGTIPTSFVSGQSLDLTTLAQVYGTYTNNPTPVLLTSGYTWESSNPAVVSVSGNTIIALSPGTAGIFVKSGTIESSQSTLTVSYPLTVTFTAQDLNGNVPATFTAGTTYNFVANVTGALAASDKVLLIVQLKGSDGTVYNIGSTYETNVTAYNKQIGVGFKVPTTAGSYTAEAFIWNKWPSQSGTQYIWSDKKSIPVTIAVQ